MKPLQGGSGQLRRRVLTASLVHGFGGCSVVSVVSSVVSVLGLASPLRPVAVASGIHRRASIFGAMRGAQRYDARQPVCASFLRFAI